MGLYFEDFETSGDLVTRGRTVTEADLVAFAGLTGDFTQLHTDEEYAKTTRFGRRIAHGALVFSISMGLATRTNMLDDTLIAFAGVDKLRFVDPVFIGDTIHLVKRVVERKEMGAAQGTVEFESRVLNQRGELVLVYRDRLLVRKRPAGSSG
ncbi:MAG TPA: MaoC/PaaZ C-terminal domain-containing protein [Vicinamibacterales bacterium]|nr:MaoC/PaaZ C-terminal domain-containing protein [Vicinamibacterales bacterium]